jgi:hypothetical protein
VKIRNFYDRWMVKKPHGPHFIGPDFRPLKLKGKRYQKGRARGKKAAHSREGA